MARRQTFRVAAGRALWTTCPSRPSWPRALRSGLPARPWLKFNPCEGAVSPDQPASERAAETVERKIELGWQKRKVAEPQAGTPLAPIPHPTRINAPEARDGEEDVPVTLLPFSGASFMSRAHRNASHGRGRHRLASDDPWPYDVRGTHRRPVAGGD